MKSVYILQHSYELEDAEETKLIGVYTSKTHAESAIERLKTKPGFCNKPEDFTIDEYILNQDSWEEGFSTMTTIQVKNKNNEWQSVEAEIMNDGNYQIIELYQNDLLDQFKHLDIVKCENRNGILYAIKKA